MSHRKRRRPKGRANRGERPGSVPNFQRSVDEISADFKRRGIDVTQPGFCDAAQFVAIERNNPEILHSYARVVVDQRYDEAYLARATEVIRVVSTALREDLRRDGTPGACAYIAMRLTRVLDYLGIWNCVFSGSLRASFPLDVARAPFHFPAVYVDPHQDMISYHCWVSAPPFRVIDLSVSQQRYQPGISPLLPDIVFATEPLDRLAAPHELIDAGSILKLARKGISPLEFLLQHNPNMFRFVQTFRGSRVSNGTTDLLYFPTAVNGCTDSIEAIALSDGRTLLDLVESEIRPRLDAP